jgi:Flp pilus assembly protein TadB
MPTLSAAVGWTLALAAVVVGYATYGWPGVVLAISVVVFWLLLQFSRALRTLREAAGRPVGDVSNALMLHAKLHAGLRLPQVLKLTRSLGTLVAQEPETFEWRDAAGDAVRVQFKDGAITSWALHRVGETPAA